MKIKVKIIAMLLILSLSLSFVSCDYIDYFEELIPDAFLPDESESYSEIQDTVTVSIIAGENFTVTSYNPIKVRRGECASFDIEIAEGYEISSLSSDATLEDGRVVLKSVSFPTSVEITLKKKSVIVDVTPDAECTEHEDENRDKTCDNCDEPYVAPCEDHIDADKNKVCDYCEAECVVPCTEHTDTDRNKKCDYCDAYYIAPCSAHTDADRNKGCDYCGAIYVAPCDDHLDVDRNKRCDYCGKSYIAPCSTHTDTNRDKHCDYCDADYIGPCTEHTDTDSSKFCDYCGAKYVGPCSNHTDIDRNKACDYCEAYYIAPCSTHTDTNRDKACDYCTAAYIAPCSDHTDTNRDKACDYCGAAYIAPCSTHTDTNRDKACDYCGAYYIDTCTSHTDTVKDQICDYCGGAINGISCGNHRDLNNDLICDSEWCYQSYYVEVLQPRPEEGFHFICWTLDRSAECGGEILTEEATATVKLLTGQVAVANYVDDGHYVILYRTNGGKVAATGADYYYQTFTNEQLYRPNTLHQNGTFTRDGYILMRYTENADGSGDYTTLGGKISVNKNGFCELWLMWGKETAKGLSYSIYENGSGEMAASVVGYTGSEKNVIIPDYVTLSVSGTTASYKVDKIVNGAFDSSQIQTLVIPWTVQVIEANAFKNCSALWELTMHDNVYEVSDASFSGCTSLRKIYMNAGRLPRFVGGAETLNSLKYDKIRYATDNNIKKIIVMSGSSSLYGFSAEQMEKAFDGEYAVINHGSNAGVSILLYMEAYLNFYREGDIIIQAPETTNGTQIGDCGMTYITWRGCECMYEIFSYVDMRNYTGFFDGLKVFNQEKRNDGYEYSYERVSNTINKYTDLTTNKDKFDYTSKTTSMSPYYQSSLTETRIAKLNAIYDKIHQTGASLYMSFAPVNKDACNATSKKPETHTAYLNKIKSSLHITVISDPMDYMLEQKYFYNSDYHPGVTGRTIRTERLIADLEAQLAKEAQGGT